MKLGGLVTSSLAAFGSMYARGMPTPPAASTGSVSSQSSPTTSQHSPWPSGVPQTHSTASSLHARNRHGRSGLPYVTTRQTDSDSVSTTTTASSDTDGTTRNGRLQKDNPTGPDKDLILERNDPQMDLQRLQVLTQVSQGLNNVNWSPLVQEVCSSSDANLGINRG